MVRSLCGLTSDSGLPILKWFHFGSTPKETMLTLTLKNIPEHLHAKLKQSAVKNRRSLNSEILRTASNAMFPPQKSIERS